MEKVTITRKIKLVINESDKDLKNEYWKRLREISKYTYRAANDYITFLYMKDQLKDAITFSQQTPSVFFKMDKKERKNLNKQSTERINLLFNNELKRSDYRYISTQYNNLPSNLIPSLLKNVASQYQTKWEEIHTGKSSLLNYRDGMPIPTIKKYLNINNENCFNWYGKIPFKIFFGKDLSNNKIIINRCLNEENWNICDSSIKIDGNDIYLLLVIQHPIKQIKLDKNTVVGVDLGIASTAVCALNKGLKRLTIPNSILKPRLRIQAQRRELQKSLKFAKGGKGRNKKLKYEKLVKVERNVVKTLNHTIAKEIVNFAVKNNAATILIEDLNGFMKEEKDNFILRNWSYFELQSFITYKAKSFGIQVEKISPTYTSQVCNSCKCKGERINQSKFKCHNKDCNINTINADFNAAKNIANGGIGLTYNKETRSDFSSLIYGAVVSPKVEPEKRTRQVPLNQEVVVS